MHIYKAIQRHPNTYILLHTHTRTHTLTNLYIHFDTHTVTHTHILSPSLSPLTCALTYSLSKCTENYTHVQHTHAQRDLSKPMNKFNKTMYTFFLSKCINSKKHCSDPADCTKCTHTQSFKDHTLPSLLIQHQLITLMPISHCTPLLHAAINPAHCHSASVQVMVPCSLSLCRYFPLYFHFLFPTAAAAVGGVPGFLAVRQACAVEHPAVAVQHALGLYLSVAVVCCLPAEHQAAHFLVADWGWCCVGLQWWYWLETLQFLYWAHGKSTAGTDR